MKHNTIFIDVDVNKKDAYGKTALYWACMGDNLKTVTHLITGRADLTMGSQSPLEGACVIGNTEIVELLLDKKGKHKINVVLK